MVIRQPNKIELIGTICCVKINSISNNRYIATFDVAAYYTYNDFNGTLIKDIGQLHVIAFDDEKGVDFKSITMLGKVHIIGRLKQELFTDNNNKETIYYKVIASMVEAIPEQECNNGFTAEEKQ